MLSGCRAPLGIDPPLLPSLRCAGFMREPLLGDTSQSLSQRCAAQREKNLLTLGTFNKKKALCFLFHVGKSNKGPKVILSFSERSSWTHQLWTRLNSPLSIQTKRPVCRGFPACCWLLRRGQRASEWSLMTKYRVFLSFLGPFLVLIPMQGRKDT